MESLFINHLQSLRLSRAVLNAGCTYIVGWIIQAVVQPKTNGHTDFWNMYNPIYFNRFRQIHRVDMWQMIFQIQFV